MRHLIEVQIWSRNYSLGLSLSETLITEGSLQHVTLLQGTKAYGVHVRAIPIPAREDRNPITVFKNPDHPQRAAIEACPPGQVLVMDARKDARAATAGSILVTRLALRGAAGLVSDGGLRDFDGIGKLDMPVYCACPSAPTNLTHHEAIEMNGPIACGDVAVFPGDVLVGDGDGVMVIPAGLADEVASECQGMESYEDFVMEQVRGGASIIGLYPATRDENLQRYELWRKENNR